MRTAPIALFVYNRPLHTQQTLEALLKNDLAAESDLFIFSDGAKSQESSAAVKEVRAYIRSVSGFRSVSIYERALNAGLAGSIIDGVTKVCDERGRVIVLEDDLVTSRWFLSYMNQALQMYEDDEEVASIHGYCYPVRDKLPETFFLRGADCWGWGTWGRAWRHFEPDGTKLLRALADRRLERAFDLDGAYSFTGMLRDQIAGKNDSWAARWHASCFLKGKLTLYPGRSLVRNIGNDASGAHCESTDEFMSSIAARPTKVERVDLVPSEEGRLAVAKFLRSTRKGILQQVLARVARRMGVSARRLA